jgi:hypothetical protein
MTSEFLILSVGAANISPIENHAWIFGFGLPTAPYASGLLELVCWLSCRGGV